MIESKLFNGSTRTRIQGDTSTTMDIRAGSRSAISEASLWNLTLGCKRYSSPRSLGKILEEEVLKPLSIGGEWQDHKELFAKGIALTSLSTVRRAFSTSLTSMADLIVSSSLVMVRSFPA